MVPVAVAVPNVADGPSTLSARVARPARVAVLLVLISCAAVGAWAIAEPTTTPSHQTARSARGWQALPVSAQSAVSAALGAQTGAFAVRRVGGGLQASNPAQRLRSSFGPAGVTIRSGATSVVFRTSAVGVGGALRPVGLVAPAADANRVSYSHAGLLEWYANGPLGLEQGFTVQHAPAGASNAPLTIALSAAGDTHAELAHGRIVFTRGGTVRLAYGGLSATDARGHALRGSMALVGGRILLRIDAEHAAYPVRIDPWIQSGGSNSPSGETGEGGYGWRVALSGNGETLLVGAHFDNGYKGSAWVFVRDGSAWNEQAHLTGGTEESGDGVFGSDVALSEDGNTALVGASGDNGSSGAVWTFTRTGSTWSQLGSKLTAPGGGSGGFGQSVALSSDGNTALIGAPFDGSGGAAWVFTRSGTMWIQQGGELTGAEEVGSGGFGEAVALSGDGNTALVGGLRDNENAGAAWFFTRADSTWSPQGGKLSGSASNAHFGRDVALSGGSGNTALIGGPESAFVYTREGSSWAQQAKLTGAEADFISNFGSAVALSSSGNTALVGANNDPDEGLGAAYVFQRTGSSWSQEGGKLTGSGEPAVGYFGESVALSSNGQFAVVGAPGTVPGHVYSFESAEPPETISPSNVSEALFVAGDVARLSKLRGGLVELIIEKALQQMYADEPGLPSETAETYVKDMQASLASPTTAPTKASLQLMPGNQRILAILATLEAPYGSPGVKLPPAAKLAVTHLAAMALAGSSDIYAAAESPKYFEPLADERSNLTYTSFSAPTVLRATWELARRNPLFGEARNAIWKSSSEESVFSEWKELFSESEDVLDGPAFAGLKTEIEEGHGYLRMTRKQLGALFGEGQKATQEQACEHGTGQKAIGAEPIAGVARLECQGGALYEASIANATSGETISQVTQKAEHHAELVAQEHALMTSAAELMRPDEERGGEVLAAAAQAQAQVTEAEDNWAKFEEEQKVRNNIKGVLELFGDAGAAASAFATANYSEGISGVVGVAFKIYGLIEENSVNEPENPEDIALTDMHDLRNQLAGFQQYTQQAFHALNVQVAHLSAELARDTYEVNLQLAGLTARLESEQQAVFALQDEVQTLFSTQVKAELETTIADSVGWLERTGEVLAPSKFQESLVALNKYATEIANGALVNKEPQPYTFEGADRQLTSQKTGELEQLNESISYLTRFPLENEWATGSAPNSLANTTFWSEGARAYAQLMLENTSRITDPDRAALNTLEDEGLKLEHAQAPLAEASGSGRSGNAILDQALTSVEDAAGGEHQGLDGLPSVTMQINEAADSALGKLLPVPPEEVGENPTGLKLWGGPLQQPTTAEAEALVNYPALQYKYVASDLEPGGHVAVTELTKNFNIFIPAVLVNGVRLGVVGAVKSGDEYEVELEKAELRAYDEPNTVTCYEATLYLKGKQIFKGSCELMSATEGREAEQAGREGNAIREQLRLADDVRFAEDQSKAYASAVEAMSAEPGPAETLAGARALVQGYVKLGLPQAVSSNVLVQSDVAGEAAQFLDPESAAPRPLPAELSALVETWPKILRAGVASAKARAEKASASAKAQETFEASTALEPSIEKDPIGEVATRSSTWANELAASVKPYFENEVEGFKESEPEPVPQEEGVARESKGEAVSQQSPLIESTINRLQLTRDVLSESTAPAAETIAPSGIGATEATLNGEVNSHGEEIEPGSCEFQYGSSTLYGETASCEDVPPTSDEPFLVSARVKGWTKDGSFHERLVVKTWGGTTYGEDVKVQLGQSGQSGTAPAVVTGAVTRIKKSAALLHGTVDPNGVAVAKCWATIQEAEGKKESLSFPCIGGVGTGKSPIEVLVRGRQMLPATKYVYRLHAENVDGEQGEGTTEEFETLAKKPKKK